MYGTPEDVPGECNAHLYLADDYADNHATLRCQFSKGHDGPHQETFERQDKPVTITWHIDERPEEEAALAKED